MQLNIIHLEHRKDRLHKLHNQLFEQNITSYKIWNGVLDEDNPKQGIAKAHKQIIQWAHDQSLPSVIIAEDDIKFTSPGAFAYFISNEPKEYDLYLGGISYGKINNDNSVKDFAGLTLYKINQTFYKTFLSLPEEMDIDRTLANRGRYIVCDPFIVIQHNGFSDNKKEYQNYDSYLQDRKLFQ